MAFSSSENCCARGIMDGLANAQRVFAPTRFDDPLLFRVVQTIKYRVTTYRTDIGIGHRIHRV
jgi:hypothetical protein